MGSTKTQTIYYDNDSRPVKLDSQSSPGDLAGVKGQRDGKLDHSCATVTKGMFSESQVKDHVVQIDINISSSAIIVGTWSTAETLWQQF